MQRRWALIRLHLPALRRLVLGLGQSSCAESGCQRLWVDTLQLLHDLLLTQLLYSHLLHVLNCVGVLQLLLVHVVIIDSLWILGKILLRHRISSNLSIKGYRARCWGLLSLGESTVELTCRLRGQHSNLGLLILMRNALIGRLNSSVNLCILCRSCILGNLRLRLRLLFLLDILSRDLTSLQ